MLVEADKGFMFMDRQFPHLKDEEARSKHYIVTKQLESEFIKVSKDIAKARKELASYSDKAALVIKPELEFDYSRKNIMPSDYNRKGYLDAVNHAARMRILSSITLCWGFKKFWDWKVYEPKRQKIVGEKGLQSKEVAKFLKTFPKGRNIAYLFFVTTTIGVTLKEYVLGRSTVLKGRYGSISPLLADDYKVDNNEGLSMNQVTRIVPLSYLGKI